MTIGTKRKAWKQWACFTRLASTKTTQCTNTAHSSVHPLSVIRHPSAPSVYVLFSILNPVITPRSISHSITNHRPTTTACETNPIRAQNNLGHLYWCGMGLNMDRHMAAMLYRSAAEQGLARAQHNLAYAILLRVGLKDNHVEKTEAWHWWIKAANQGFLDAQSCLGSLCTVSSHTSSKKLPPPSFYDGGLWPYGAHTLQHVSRRRTSSLGRTMRGR